MYLVVLDFIFDVIILRRFGGLILVRPHREDDERR